jgi:hypothetical protein
VSVKVMMIGKLTDSFQATIQTELSDINPKDFHFFTFLPAAGNALFDIFEFYQTSDDGKPIALFKQLNI